MVDSLRLVLPTFELQNQYLEMLADWQSTGEKLIPFVLKFDPSDFEALIKQLEDYRLGVNLPQGYVPGSTFWLINADLQILGIINIRHFLNDSLLEHGGNIGYGIRPSERRKGYATKMLKLALAEAKKIGLKRVLITCDKDNIGSQRTIIRNGGQLESEILYDGIPVQRYWIELS